MPGRRVEDQPLGITRLVAREEGRVVHNNAKMGELRVGSYVLLKG